ncbi:hypothetical protein FD41_GL000995 [Lentilactobacillus farraginis DSM 18382 = JCM 14108]|uniref:Uncharacterized protein n=1 Tax=Lentilactobacillus farraginis DSM 18382 = JCM 14108 TaxID=1423743 RepID=X0QEW6_9LACO|nr:hypothetical protein FD41_GL000995 [Lentilactobacillus farraginis DSM 18382 = JCM 14108]GAF37155.1 hypothetical protein JCM14108_2170 [Lentilactobacillus farraginis DSM 18382 = JCM 14108]
MIINLAWISFNDAQYKSVSFIINSTVTSVWEAFIIDVAVTLLEVAQARFAKMMSYKFDMALGGWTGDIYPFSMLQQFYSTFPHNHAKSKDHHYDQLLNKIQYHDLNNSLRGLSRSKQCVIIKRSAVDSTPFNIHMKLLVAVEESKRPGQCRCLAFVMKA